MPLVDRLNDADLLQEVRKHRPNGPTQPAQGTHLLPMAFPEGSPMHPSYGAGHATVAGACVTILKAFFDESDKLPFAFQADPSDPTKLQHLTHLNDTLTVGTSWPPTFRSAATWPAATTSATTSSRSGSASRSGAPSWRRGGVLSRGLQHDLRSFDRAADGRAIDITIEKTGDEVVKRQQVRPMPAAAAPTVLPIAAA